MRFLNQQTAFMLQKAIFSMAGLMASATLHNAHASILGDAERGFNSATGTISGGVSQISGSMATSVDKGIRFATEQGRTLALVSKEEFADNKKRANAVLAETSAQTDLAYRRAIAGISALNDFMLFGLLRQQANSFVSGNRGDLRALTEKTDKLSDQARAALRRIMIAMPGKVVTSSVKADMQLIATELGLNTMFRSVRNSSWGIAVGADAGYGLAGVNQGLAIAMNVNPERDGSYRGAIVSSSGASAGLDMGLGANVSLFWQPDVVSESTGLSLGFGLSVEDVIGGGGMQISFPISVDPKDYATPIAYARSRLNTLVPSFGISLTIPGTVVTAFKASADLNAGWSQVLVSFNINPNEICQFIMSTAGAGLGPVTTVKPGTECPGTFNAGSSVDRAVQSIQRAFK